jgi:hypothetical protein
MASSSSASSSGDATLYKFEGGCHCRRVRFRVALPPVRRGPNGEPEFEASECNCSMCRKKGILHMIVPPERFELLSGADALATYTFNTGIAKHTFCSFCGMHPFYTPRSHPDQVDVNARCLDDELRLSLRNFDGKNWETAMEASRAAAAVEVKR